MWYTHNKHVGKVLICMVWNQSVSLKKKMKRRQQTPTSDLYKAYEGEYTLHVYTWGEGSRRKRGRVEESHLLRITLRITSFWPHHSTSNCLPTAPVCAISLGKQRYVCSICGYVPNWVTWLDSPLYLASYTLPAQIHCNTGSVPLAQAFLHFTPQPCRVPGTRPSPGWSRITHLLMTKLWSPHWTF